MARIDGTSENDYLTGTPENDVIVGGLGNDFLTGNGGADTFVLQNVTKKTFVEGLGWLFVESDDGFDIITDFKEGEDKIISTAVGSSSFDTSPDDNLSEVDNSDSISNFPNLAIRPHYAQCSC